MTALDTLPIDVLGRVAAMLDDYVALYRFACCSRGCRAGVELAAEAAARPLCTLTLIAGPVHRDITWTRLWLVAQRLKHELSD